MTLRPLPPASGDLAPAPAPSGLTLLDQARIRRALESSTSANTRRAYNQAWRRFLAWTGARSVPALPATPDVAAAFLAELAEEGLSVATLRLQKSALAKVHRSAGHPDPTENEGGEAGHGRHCPGQRQAPAPGEAAHRGGPWRR